MDASIHHLHRSEFGCCVFRYDLKSATTHTFIEDAILTWRTLACVVFSVCMAVFYYHQLVIFKGFNFIVLWNFIFLNV